MKKRMNRNQLQIGTYYLQPYARTERHIRELRECGIDFVIGMQAKDRAALDLFARYGVGAVVNDVVPGWWGGNGENAGTLEATNPMEAYEKGIREFHDHPAVWGIDVGDEPSALDFPYYGRVFQKVAKSVPHLFPYLNLYPNYASVAGNSEQETHNQLGTATYGEHIEEYCRNVPADYLCYDFYVYSASVRKMYENLRTVSDACRRTGRSMWIVLQVNSNREERLISENQLRFQAATAMAYGAEVITWACYTAGWWYHQVLDEKGEKTEQYEKLKKVNAELHTLGREYMKFTRTETHLVGFDTIRDSGETGEKRKQADTGFFREIRSTEGKPIVVAEMTGRKNRSEKAIFVVAADDPLGGNGQPGSVTFTVDPFVRVEAYGGAGRIPVRKKNGRYVVEIPPCAGILIKAK